MCKESGNKGIFIDEEFDNIGTLIYADDLNHLSDTVGHLQSLINVLSSFCYKWEMKVNMDKTKIIVFRNGGVITKNER